MNSYPPSILFAVGNLLAQLNVSFVPYVAGALLFNVSFADSFPLC